MFNDFDARSVQPRQGFASHPFGMFDFQISNTYLKENTNKTGGMLAVEFTSPAGTIEKFYNLFHPNADAVRIAQEQLSALCHAVGVFQVAFPKKPDGSPVFEMAGHTLRGARGRMEVAPQKRKDDKGQLVETGYAEVVKVFDSAGNEPGKAPTNNAPAGGVMTQQPGGGWGGNNGQQQPPQNNQPQQNSQPQGNWGNGNQQQPQNNAPPQNNGGGWGGNNGQQQPQNGGGQTAPWAK